MKEFEEMTYDELKEAQSQIEIALRKNRVKTVRTKARDVVKAIDDFCNFIEELGGDPTSPCFKYHEDIDLIAFKNILNLNFVPEALFDDEEEQLAICTKNKFNFVQVAT